MPIVGLQGETEAQVRNRAKARVRVIRRSVRRCITRFELMERRLDKLLTRDTLIQVASFDSYLRNHDEFVKLFKGYERELAATLVLFAQNFG